MSTDSNGIEEIRRLFYKHVPEVADGQVEVKGIARERGSRCIVAVFAAGPNSNPVGACVGIKGVRIKTILNELSGEKCDVVRWSDSTETLLSNCFCPIPIRRFILDLAARQATLQVRKDDYDPAGAKEVARLRLISRLVGLEIKVIQV